MLSLLRVSCSSLVCAAAISAHAGPLTPPAGPVAPTMKTLDEVEPSTPVHAVNTPGDATATYVISAPGAYHLTGNLMGEAGKNGVRITADDVTLDLRGFTMQGLNDPGGAGESMNAVFGDFTNGVVIRNGHIVGWPLDGVSMRNGDTAVAEDLIVRDMGEDGVVIGDRSTARRINVFNVVGTGVWVNVGSLAQDCVIDGAALRGINVNGGARVENCIVLDAGEFGVAGPGFVTVRNTTVRVATGTGIGTGIQGTIEHCTVRSVGGSGISVGDNSAVRFSQVEDLGIAGIMTGSNARVESCVVENAANDGVRTGIVGAVVDCNIRTTGAEGIDVGETSSVIDCTVNNAATIGILADNRCQIRGNKVDFCAPSLPIVGYAISVGFSNVIEGNALTRADYLIHTSSGANTIVNNRLGEPFTGPTDLTGINSVAPFLDPTTMITTPHPQANILH